MGLETAHVGNIVCTRTSCYSLHPVANPPKWPKAATTAYLSINNGKTKAVLSFSQAYSSEGVLPLTVDTRERVAKPSGKLHKVREADFCPFRTLVAH